MPSHLIAPCIWLDDQAEQAAALYTRTFPETSVVATGRYPESADNPSGRPRGSVAVVELELAGQPFTLLNGGPMFVPSPTISFFVRVDTAADADRVFAALAEGGQVLMPLDAYPWSERYAWVQDRFRVSWQVIAGRRPPGASATMVPCLMFAGPQHGRAEEALRAYAGVFPGGRILSVERYAAGEGPDNTVKHGRVELAGDELVAMDSHLAEGMTFDEGVSLQVRCEDQAEVDRYWSALSAGGAEGPCGWLKDRFGVSWQVGPRRIVEWMAGADPAARDRAFAAVMGMRKLDVAQIERAYQGR